MAKKNLGGRPSKKSPESIKKLEEAFALDCTIREACFYVGITPTTYYTWMEDDPKLLERLELLREKPVLTARKTVVQGLAYSPELALKYLERKKKSEFSTRQENTGADGGPIEYAELTPEQTKAMNSLIRSRSTGKTEE